LFCLRPSTPGGELPKPVEKRLRVGFPDKKGHERAGGGQQYGFARVGDNSDDKVAWKRKEKSSKGWERGEKGI